MKKTTFAVCVLMTGTSCLGQDYIDILKAAYSNTRAGFKNSGQKTTLHSVDVSILTPLLLNNSTFILTGADFNSRSLSLYPNSSQTSLYNTVFKLGLSKNLGGKLNAYIIALPKFSSDYKSNFSSSFLLGGIGLVKYKKRENLTYKLGFYGSQEAYGFFGTPIVGFFYRNLTKNYPLTPPYLYLLMSIINFLRNRP